MSNRGLSELRTPTDLLRKLEHDLARIERDPLDAYAAFDFFATAHLLLDRIYSSTNPKARADRKAAEATDYLVQLCAQIANGSTLFAVVRPKPESPRDVYFEPGAFAAVFDPALHRGRL